MVFRLPKIAFWIFFLCFLAPVTPNRAQDRQAVQPQLFNLKITPNQTGAELIATFTAKPDYRMIVLDKPMRLVIDLSQTNFEPTFKPIGTDLLKNSRLIRYLAYGLNGVGDTRLIVEAIAPFKVSNLHVEPLHEDIWQMVIDLEPTTSQDFTDQAALMRQNFPVHLPDTQLKNLQQQATPSLSPFTIVIDAGHGGFDSGAEGITGILEKDVTLAFAHTLREILMKENPDFVVSLTRETDIFLRLSERIAIARARHSDLFISIHADFIHIPSLRGATIYTLSDQASDTLARTIAENENRSDLLDGLPPDEPLAITDILLDLTRRETDALSTRFADELIDHFNQAGIRLIHPAHRYAGFMVLRAPEIPSVLVELGYLSNQQDEELISDPAWRTHIATIVAQAIKNFSLNRRGQQK